MHTEDDTFATLIRVPFNDVIRNCMRHGEEFDDVLSAVIDMVAVTGANPTERFSIVAPGWTFEDFEKECIKRSK